MVAQKKTPKTTPKETSVTPVVEVKESVEVQEPVVVKEPVVAEAKETQPAQKAGGAKKGKKEAAPASVKPPVAEPKQTKGKGKKAVDAEAKPVKAAAKGKGKAAAKKEATAETEGDVEDDGKTRSFKVQLPNEEDFSGRFTGLTPYQAANKALSKFFRNTENNNITAEPVLFSIKESTRGSKRSVYTYKGTRVKLEKAITYTIKSATGEERVITKQYKNQLIKIKKGAAPVVQPVANA